MREWGSARVVEVGMEKGRPTCVGEETGAGGAPVSTITGDECERGASHVPYK